MAPPAGPAGPCEGAEMSQPSTAPPPTPPTTPPSAAIQQSHVPAQWSTPVDFKFSAGPWNLHGGADPFGPAVRPEREFVAKLKVFKDLGFDYVQFHDDDAVPDDFSQRDREKRAKEVKKLLDDHGLKAEIF